MPSLTVENYLKAILQTELRSGEANVSTGKLAEELEVSPGTVTSMLKTLAEQQQVDYTPYEGVQLTDIGRQVAMKMLRRHRLIELFLVQTLNLSWDQVHEEAEHMEHAVSDALIEAIDEYLGRPVADPHGDPIPTAEGVMRRDHSSARPLSECAAGTEVRFVRVTNQDSDFLRFLSESGIDIGVAGTVEINSPEAGLVVVQIAEAKISMGRSAAEALLVE
ncbi:metal-dependent transcriptional regulator [Calycomorphotria hydatis]|uniref:Transcriptional regulator MntR n=1 Tax=Calycomorphotria hydatis TaxID=2528027 RepID=A0A517T492_9PLAN|nr:metal-dependent transcriptional regulator [Calycomorphotria hydatis]QDT63197.1 Iron-dependent repressor IdeR [Calycomorphotria hydatis]